jgi:two-component system, OmpR family, phosphate regulon sensor histidine kinase PhoR
MRVGEADVAGQVARNESGLQRLSDFHAALVAMAGHDLRQPLQIIVGMHAWLTKRLTEQPEREHLERGRRAIGQLVQQLDHLVDSLRIFDAAGDVRPTPIQVEPLLTRVEDEHAESAREKDLALKVIPARAVILSDNVLLSGILRNLVRNALKYTPAGGSVLVGCRRRGTLLRIEVHDTGVGIAADNLDKVFQAFAQVGSSAAGGHGLGLFIVKRAADSLGHRLEVRSDLGRGSCFSVLANLGAGGYGAVKLPISHQAGPIGRQMLHDPRLTAMTESDLRFAAWRAVARAHGERFQ